MRSFWVFLNFQILLGFFLGASVTFAGSNSSLVYSGRILRPDGSAINVGAMTVTLAIKDASNNCTLWKETHAISMADSSGTFALTVGTGTRTDGGTHTFKQVFINAGTLTGLTCVSGTTYSPSSSDDRNLAVSFDDAGTVVNLGAVAIKSVPYAMQADQVSGYGIMNLAKISGLGTTTTITGPQFDFLANLSAPASATATPCAANDTLKFVGGVWTCAAAGGGSASTSGLTSATGTNSIDNTNFNQTWNWSTLSNQTGLSLTTSSNSLVSGGTLLNVANTGTSTNGTVARIQSNTTAGSGLTVLANGNVGIGTASPTARLEVEQSPAIASKLWGNGGTTNTFEIWDHSTSQPLVAFSWAGNMTMRAPNANITLNEAWGGSPTFNYQLNGVTKFSMGTDVSDSSFKIGTTNMATNTRMTILSTGNVGIGTTSPATSLDVAGEVKVGNSSTACSTTNKGSIRYNNASSVLEFCNGSSWNLIQAAACSDATPTSFTFNDESNQVVSTLITSNIVQVSGLNCTVPVTVSGVGSPQLQICSDAGCSTVVQGWTSSPSSIVSGQYLQLRLTSDAAGGATTQATVIAGGTASIWSVSTAGGDCVATTPPVGTVCADGTVFAGLTPDGSVKMFATRCDYGQTWNGAACIGSRLLQAWNNGTANYIITGYNNNNTGKTNSAGLAASSDIGSPYGAATSCENLNQNGHTDWYLPALNELSLLYTERNTIRNFSTGYYWASSESSSSNARYLLFSDGSTWYIDKTGTYNIRCVRR